MTLACLLTTLPRGAPAEPADAPQLEVTPRVCTLAGAETQCKMQVRASWHTVHPESLCLIVPDRPDLKRCWEKASQGTYIMDLTITDDLIFELEDALFARVLASQVVHVIRDTRRYRHRRRDPWNIFE